MEGVFKAAELAGRSARIELPGFLLGVEADGVETSEWKRLLPTKNDLRERLEWAGRGRGKGLF